MPTSETRSSDDLVIYQTPGGSIELREDVKAETIWVTQAQIAEIFGTQRPAVTKHIQNIFDDNELEEISVCSKMEHTAADGKKYQVMHYNLDVIIAVGYRVNSKKATAFRRWATKILREHLTKGYTINESRLAQLEHGMQGAQRAIELAKTAIGQNMDHNNLIKQSVTT